jgi:hypothetical protein
MTEQEREKRRSAWRKWAKNNPEDRKAHTKKYKETSKYYKEYRKQEGKNQTVRKELENKKAKKCASCGTTEGTMIMHHKDNNEQNNALSNLEWRCPVCHGKTKRK